MTPDLIARLREVGRDGVWKSGRKDNVHPMCAEAADALETLMEHAEAMAEALIRVSDIVDRNLYRQHEKIEDVPKIARRIEDAFRAAFPGEER